MKRIICILFNILCLAYIVSAQTLGNYPATSVVAGRNISVNPASSPGGSIARINAYATTGFQGVITVNPSTGKVTIIDAKPAGYYTITVKAYTSSGTSTAKTFVLTVKNNNCSQANFSSASDVHTGLNQLSVVVGDFNNDGKQDIAAAHEGGNNTLSIRLGNGSGGFSGTTEIPVGSHPFNLAIGDFNNDGKQDIVIANSGANMVSVLLGNGAGGFSTMPVVTVASTPVSIAVGDFNGDGKQDFVTANLNANNVSVRLGDGSGGFNGNTNIAVGTFPYCVVLGDFDNNGKLDLATANSGSSTVSIRLGNGTGGFTGTTSVSVGSYPYGLTIGDFNNDGKLDLATANYIGNSISIRKGDGLGGFNGNAEIGVGSNPYYITQGNFNGDDNVDLATANYFSNSVSIRFGNGSGGFIDTVELSVGSYPMNLIAGEFNNDSIMDLAVSNFNDANISIRLGVAGISPLDSILSNSPVCQGMDIDLKSNHGALFSWTGPNGFTSSLQNIVVHDCEQSDSGYFHVEMIDSANCKTSASTYVRINPLPVVTFSLPFDTLCSGNPVQTLSGGFPAPGIYSGIGVYNSDQFDPGFLIPDDYFINYTYTDSNDCSNTQKDKIHLVVCLDVPEQNFSQLINVFPNPVRSDFTVDIPHAKKCEMILYTPEGKVAREWPTSEIETGSFSLDGLIDGIYFLKLFFEDHYGIVKIIKQE